MTIDAQLAELRADASRRAPEVPALDGVVEDAGRQRLAAYYLYSAVIAGVIGDDGLAPARWPREVAESMERFGLTRLGPRTERALDAELTPAEQAARRSPARQSVYARLLVDLINQGAFGPLCGDADSVRLAVSSGQRGADLELIAGGIVVGRCAARDHWELVARQLAAAPHGDDPLADTASGRAPATKAARWLKGSSISHAVTAGITLAVHVYPLGVAVGEGSRLVWSRIQTGREQADALRRLGQVLHSLRDQAYGELSDSPA